MRNILFISHNNNRTGASLVLLHLVEWIKKHHPSVRIDILALQEGDLSQNFRKVAKNYYSISKPSPKQKKPIFYWLLKLLFSKIYNFIVSKFIIKLFSLKNYDTIYANTILCIPIGKQIAELSGKNTKLIGHIHELDFLIQKFLPSIQNYIPVLEYIIVPSQIVKENLVTKYSFSSEKIKVIHSFSKVKFVNEKLSKKSKPFHVGGSGYASWWKGVDIFILVARYIQLNYPETKIKFTWVGNMDKLIFKRYSSDIKKMGLEKIINLIGESNEPTAIYQSFDLFLLTSRSDSFPLVCIENGMLGKPIIYFKGVTGTEEILKKGGGFAVPYLDIQAMAEKIIFYLNNPDIKKKDGEINKKQFSQFTAKNKCPLIYKIIEKVS